jgi:hypothetical protein
MPDCCKVEETTKCRFLFYDKTTGDVLDVGSGGGAGEALTGDAFIMWRFNDATAPSRIGCIPYYFNPLGMTDKPIHIDLAKAAGYEAKSRDWNIAKNNRDAAATHAAFEDM